MNLYRQSVCN